MKVHKPDSLSLLTRVFGEKKSCYLSLSVMAMFGFDHPDELAEEGKLWDLVGEALAKNEFLDVGMPKPDAELLVKGKFFSPHGKPTPGGQVGVSLGPIAKTLDVFGDRFRGKTLGVIGAVTDPKPITEMDLSYAHAFGGPGFARNPIGKGYAPKGGAPGPCPLPNVEDPRHLIASSSDEPDPAGFLPLDFMHPDRVKKTGTYDDEWKNNNWPYFPDDFNWSYFNAAPPDQWLKGFFRGGEVISISNMHPDKPLLESRLPALRTRCFVQRQESEKTVFIELQTHWDTVWLFPEFEAGICIWRGVAQTSDDEAENILHVVIDFEKISEQPQPIDYYYQKILTPPEEVEPEPAEPPEEEALEPQLSAPAVALAGGMELSPAQQSLAGMIDTLERQEARLQEKMQNLLFALGVTQEKSEAALKQMQAGYEEVIKARGLEIELPPPVVIDESVPPEQQIEMIERHNRQLNQMLDDAVAKLGLTEEQFEQARQKMSDGVQEVAESARARGIESEPPEPLVIDGTANPVEMLERIEKYQSGLQAKLGNALQALGIDPNRPPIAIAPPELKELLQLDFLKDVAGLRRAGVNLPPEAEDLIAAFENSQKQVKELIDQAGRVKGESPKVAAAPEDAAGVAGEDGLEMTAAEEAGGGSQSELEIPAEEPPVPSCPEAFEQEIKQGKSFAGADLSGFAAPGANLIGADLSGADLAGANLSGANLAGANLSGGMLLGASLAKAKLGKACLKGCSAAEAKLEGADFTGADLAEADFAGADLTGADFTGAKLDAAVFEKAKLDQAVFAGCSAVGTDFSGASLAGASFVGAVLTRADFSQAMIEGSDFSKATGDAVSFEGAQGGAVKFVEAELASSRADHQTKLPNAVFTQAGLVDSCWEGAQLPRADFQHARLSRADFSRAQLQESRLAFADAAQARFSKADLTNANLEGANLFQAMFDKSSLEHANMRAANLYEAEFLHARIASADWRDANLKMTKLENWSRK